MTIELFATFLVASVILALTPGPTMSLVIANGASHGAAAGLWTVAGNSLGLVLLITAATVGMTSIMGLMAQWFDVIRWIGAAYLVWLGATRLWRALQPGDDLPVRTAPRGRYFWQGLAVALSNPKVLLFFGAFFPQFIDPTAALAPQFVILATSFVITVTVIDCGYALAAGTARGWLTARRQRVGDGIAGCLLIGGGIWLAAARRT